MRWMWTLVWLAGTAWAEEGARSLMRDLMEARESLSEVPFAEVVQASTGRKVLPVVAGRDGALLARIGGALDEVMRRVGEPGHPAHDEKRINEVSRHFEEAIRAVLAATPGFECDYPLNAEGRPQRSGYPDLRLVDVASGRVIYLDPKLFAAGSRSSSLRTFYFTPQQETGKIHEDAHHLLIGIAHHGKEDGRWRFGTWELVDLSRFRVRLKLEFQAGNRDLYRDENIVLRGEER